MNLLKSANVSDYNLIVKGKKIRVATKVSFADGTIIHFLDKMPKLEAIKQALVQKKKREVLQETFQNE